MDFIRKHIIVIIGMILILSATIIRIFCEFDFYSDSILAITALIILWYTYETSEIRKSENIVAKANEENQKRFKSPL